MGDNIKVVARFRPTNEREKAEMESKEQKLKLNFLSDTTVEVTLPPTTQHRFTFDRTYPPDTKQDDFYNGVARQTVSDVLAGFNGTVFAYGQTGAGKSFTMMGPEGSMLSDLRGLIPRAAQQLFDAIRSDKGDVAEWKIKCSYLEIYLETVTDLMRPELTNLKVRETPSQGVWVEGLTEEYVTCEQDIFDLLVLGGENRAVSATKMNAVSSRSHSVFIIIVEQRATDGSTKSGRLNLVDLAGSEKVGKTGATGTRLEEAKKINLSLSALGNCINTLTKAGHTHVPFRDSKLTHLLKDSLGGNTKTTLVIACSPSEFNIVETIDTMRFGERAKTIKNKPKVNKMLSAAELQRIVEKLTKDLEVLRAYCTTLERQIDPKKLAESKAMLQSNVQKVADAEAASLADGDSPLEPTHLAAEGILELSEAKLQLQQLKEKTEIIIGDLREEVEFLKTREDENQAKIDAARKEVEEAAQRTKALEASCNERCAKLELEKKHLVYEAEQRAAEVEELHEAVRTVSAQAHEAEMLAVQREQALSKLAKSKPGASGSSAVSAELEKKLEAMRREMADVQERATQDVTNVLEELNQSEARNAELADTLKRMSTEVARLQDDGCGMREAAALAQHKLALRTEEVAALRKAGATTAKDLEVSLARVEKQLELSSRKHAEEMKKLRESHRTQVEAMQKEIDHKSAEKAVLEGKIQDPELVTRLKKEIADLKARASSGGAPSSDEAERLATELRAVKERLQTETTEKLLLEPRLRQLSKQTKRLEEVESELTQVTGEREHLRKELGETRTKCSQLETQVATLTEKVAELAAANERMLRRPSNKIYRPATGQGFSAFTERLDIEQMPSKLKTTGSSLLAEARNQDRRSRTFRGDVVLDSGSGTPPASTSPVPTSAAAAAVPQQPRVSSASRSAAGATPEKSASPHRSASTPHRTSAARAEKVVLP